MDINRNKADEPEALQTQIVNGFTTVTSENVYDNVVDVNLDCQYTFYDADGHVMDRLIADFCDLSPPCICAVLCLGTHSPAISL